jgi:glycosyltransferase involved in cell wall biosynthesis
VPQLASDRGLAGQVTFLGWRTARETEALLGASDVLALSVRNRRAPLRAPRSDGEPPPRHCGRVYGVPEVVEDGVTGILVDPRDTDDIAAALDRLADVPLRERMGEAARARFERDFTLEHHAARMQELYRALLGSSRRARGIVS